MTWIAWKFGVIYAPNVFHFAIFQIDSFVFDFFFKGEHQKTNTATYHFSFLSCGRLFKFPLWLVELTPVREDFIFSNHTENQQSCFFFFSYYECLKAKTLPVAWKSLDGWESPGGGTESSAFTSRLPNWIAPSSSWVISLRLKKKKKKVGGNQVCGRISVTSLKKCRA